MYVCLLLILSNKLDLNQETRFTIISTLCAKYLYDECHILSFVFHFFAKLNVECCFVECRVAVLNVVVTFMCCVCVSAKCFSTKCFSTKKHGAIKCPWESFNFIQDGSKKSLRYKQLFFPFVSINKLDRFVSWDIFFSFCLV